MTLDILDARETHSDAARGELEPREGGPGNKRPDVVQHQTPDRRIGLGRDHHPDQAAHRSADPVDSLPLARSLEAAQQGNAGSRRGEPREQRRGVGEILRETVVFLVLEPVAVTAADDVHAHDPAAPGGERRRELVEIPAVARETVHAHDDVPAVRVSPFRISDAVESVRPEREEVVVARFVGHWTFVVPGEGIEPTWCCHRRILSPLRLPVPPSRLDAAR